MVGGNACEKMADCRWVVSDLLAWRRKDAARRLPTTCYGLHQWVEMALDSSLTTFTMRHLRSLFCLCSL